MEVLTLDTGMVRTVPVVGAGRDKELKSQAGQMRVSRSCVLPPLSL